MGPNSANVLEAYPASFRFPILVKGDLKAIFDSSLFLLPLFLPQTVLLIVFSIYKELSPLIVTDATGLIPFLLVVCQKPSTTFLLFRKCKLLRATCNALYNLALPLPPVSSLASFQTFPCTLLSPLIS